jgi:hypothetical protein
MVKITAEFVARGTCRKQHNALKLGMLTDIRIYPVNLLSVVIRISHYPITDTNMAAVAS